MVSAACDVLAAGADSPALRMLAAVSYRTAHTEMAPLLEAALRELDLPPPSADGAVRAMCARTLAGEVTPRGLASWVHRTFGHDRAVKLAEFDDAYDIVDYTEETVENIDAAVLAEARRLLAAGPDAG